jgi:hypothetical protein
VSDCELPTLFDRRLRVARKVHACCECRHPIVPGEKYHDTKGLWDGSWERYRVCECCEKKRCALAAYFKDVCIAFGEVAEFLAEYEREVAA